MILIVTILIGIAGAIVGGFLGTFVGLGKVEPFDLRGIFIASIPGKFQRQMGPWDYSEDVFGECASFWLRNRW